MAFGKTVMLRADDSTVRILCDGVEIAVHSRSYDRCHHVEDPEHIERLLARRQSARGPKRRERLLAVCPQARLYLREVSRRRIHLSHEVERLLRLLDQYGDPALPPRQLTLVTKRPRCPRSKRRAFQ
jgi:hypothetical protein